MAPPIPGNPRLLDDVALRQVVDAHGMCVGRADSDRWFPDTTHMSDRAARRLCAGCPLTGAFGACFELAVREDVARNRDRKISPDMQLRLYDVRGGIRPANRAKVVRLRLLAEQKGARA